MRLDSIARAAIYITAVAGCSGELAQRQATGDPTSAAAAEAPYVRPPAYEADPLLSPVPPKSADPGGHTHAAHPPDGAEPKAHTVYTCPMHPDVRAAAPGKCPRCGMTLV